MKAQMNGGYHIIVWKSNYINTTEFTTVKTGTSIDVDGHITGECSGKLLMVNYQLTINKFWEIQSFHLELQSDTSFSLQFQKNRNNEWVDYKGEVHPRFNECTDIDISLTPFTNTLTINRLNLPEGSSEENDVFYINLPANQCKPVKQRYTNLGKGVYKYENLDTGFTADIEVDEDGYVVNYPGIWQRLYSKK